MIIVPTRDLLMQVFKVLNSMFNFNLNKSGGGQPTVSIFIGGNDNEQLKNINNKKIDENFN